MAITIEPYTSDRIPAVRAFNQRLRDGGCAFAFPEQSESSWLPKSESDQLCEEYFVAVEGDEVRGGYILKRQPFVVGNGLYLVGSLYLPLSEGAVNPAYGRLGLQLLQNALKREPLLYSLGMGGFWNPYPRLLKASSWHLEAVPFHFYVVNAANFCREIQYLRRNPLKRLALDFLRLTGLGNLLFKQIHAWYRRRAVDSPTLRAEVITEFTDWTETLWYAGVGDSRFVAVRNEASLQMLYPAHKEKYLKLRVTDAGITYGWAVVLDTAMSGHKQFGDMRVGSIIDCFAASGGADKVAEAATQFLIQRGADLIVTNQSHPYWNEAFDRAGLLRGPSNFIFAASPRLAAELWKHPNADPLIHITRGDGEGPTHL